MAGANKIAVLAAIKVERTWLSAIPATFILDENGVILTRNLRGLQLEQKIEELFSSM